jgi:hypothetical protein
MLPRTAIAFVPWLLLVPFLTTAVGQESPDGEPARVAVPDSDAIKKADEVVHEVYKEDYAHLDAPGKHSSALAEKLLHEAAATGNEDAARFVLLSEAGRLARADMNAELALRAVDLMDKCFVLDGWSERVKLATELSKAVKTSAQTKDISEWCVGLSERAIREGAYEASASIASLANNHAGKISDANLKRRIADQLKRANAFQQLNADYTAAMAQLAQKPEDAALNETAGRFLCFVKNNWNEGLLKLVRANSSTLAELAKAEIQAPNTPEAMVALGDGWWTVAETIDPAILQTAVREHAGDWYRRALPQSAGLIKAKLLKRLDGLSPGASPLPIPVAQEGTGQPIANRIVTACDYFVVDVWQNGKLVPMERRQLVGEAFGAQLEQINMSVKAGDWVVFQVASNGLRWDGAQSFSAAGMRNEKEAAFCTESKSGNWSYCDDFSDAQRFISDRSYLAKHRAKAALHPWGDAEVRQHVANWSGEAIWGGGRCAWIKYTAPDR